MSNRLRILLGTGDQGYQTVGRNPAIWVDRIGKTRWFYVELYDQSKWLVPRCRYEDSRNCYWNAERRGNGEGRSFVDIGSRHHLVDYRFQP
jgi:type 1 glutamine amidotransferase